MQRLAAVSESPLVDKTTAKSRLLFRTDGGIHLLRIDEIRWIESEGDYVKTYADLKSRLVRMLLTKILQRLDTADFLRIHRSAVVNLLYSRKASPAPYGE